MPIKAGPIKAVPPKAEPIKAIPREATSIDAVGCGPDRDGAVLAATIILVRNGTRGDGEGLEVLLLRRNPKANNMANIWMFPGGKVDPEDSGSTELERAASGCVRELCEEAGVRLSPHDLATFAHWLTPEGMKRRFATWFFIAAAPEDCGVEVDGEEMVEARWLPPAEAVSEYQAGTLRLPPPTAISLTDLAASNSVEQALSAASERTAPYFFPKVDAKDPDNIIMLYPGDAGYEMSDSSIDGQRHRAHWIDGVVSYERSFKFPLRS